MRGLAFFIAALFFAGMAGTAMAGPSFEPVWEKTFSDTVKDVAISADGSTVAARTDSTLHCYTADGALLWEVPGGHGRHLGISGDGSLVAVDGEDLRAYDGTGARVFRHTNGYFALGVGISPDGSCIAGGFDNESLVLFRKNAVGVFLPSWSVRTDDDIVTLDLADNATSLVAGTKNGMVLRYAGDGRLLWRYGTGSSSLSCSVTGDGSYIAVGADHGVASCINRNGNLLWTTVSGDRLPGVGVAGEGALIAVGGEGIVLNSPGGEVLSTVIDTPAHALAISGDGKRIVAAGEGKRVTLYQAREETPGIETATMPATPPMTDSQETAPAEPEAARSPLGACSAIIAIFTAMYGMRRH
ncbi:MAG: PQQ-binding-like beta-propeller repeat protein [Methanofollis sp.]|uniref:WD40 repeat domain-containing protein n=1 Tax=Methanofollis sp. TaxID=2052835 RepID=UPI002617D6E1|nr:PQQ-binding-like beta-propeller repeat protein [Methanofollis sp.]MDD4255946.1 PQQ-binding-like beta-propeller repeat protein [Methanofollis sp.]